MFRQSWSGNGPASCGFFSPFLNNHEKLGDSRVRRESNAPRHDAFPPRRSRCEHGGAQCRHSDIWPDGSLFIVLTTAPFFLKMRAFAQRHPSALIVRLDSCSSQRRPRWLTLPHFREPTRLSHVRQLTAVRPRIPSNLLGCCCAISIFPKFFLTRLHYLRPSRILHRNLRRSFIWRIMTKTAQRSSNPNSETERHAAG